MPRRLVVAFVVMGILAGVLALVACDKPGAGSPATDPAGSTETRNPSPSGGDEYWTDERMRSASPEPMPTEP